MPKTSPHDGFNGLGVLVVESDKYMRFSVHRELDRLDATVFEAGSNDEALKRLDQFPVSVVIYDVETAADGGKSFLAKMQQTGHHLPVLALAKERTTKSCFAAQLTKPVSAVDLTTAVYRLAGGIHYLH